MSFSDNSKGFTKGHGSLTNGCVTLCNVSYVEGLKHTLLSVSQICVLKNKVLFDNSQVPFLTLMTNMFSQLRERGISTL